MFDIKDTVPHNTYYWGRGFLPWDLLFILCTKNMFMNNYYPPCSVFFFCPFYCCALKKRLVKYWYEPFRIRFIFHVVCLFIGMITKAVLKSSEEEKKEEEVKKTLEQHDSIVTQYKELIREQVKMHQTVPFSHLSQCNVSNNSLWLFFFLVYIECIRIFVWLGFFTRQQQFGHLSLFYMKVLHC